MALQRNRVMYILFPRGSADGAPSSEDSTDIPYNAAEEERRAWGFPTDDEHTFFDGLEPSFVYIRDFLAKQTVPFDGVLGFSQGAAIASMTACLVSYCESYISTQQSCLSVSTPA